MKYSDISKLQAAESQLKTAIELFFNDRDSISIHTLASASQEILETLGDKKGIKSERLKMLEVYDPEDRKKIHSKLWYHKNFFKHADRQPNDITTLNPEYTELIIWDAVRLYYFITKKKVPAFLVYDLWMYSKLPELYNLSAKEEKLYKETLSTNGKNHQDKLHFLNMIATAERELRENIKPNQQLLFYDNKEYSLKELAFDNDTKVWNCFYTLNRQDIDMPEEAIIINFFIENLWANTFTAEYVAKLFINTNTNILGSPFTAPDGITGKPAYFILSTRANGGGFYLDITKISSIKNSVFTITYSKEVQKGDVELKMNVDNLVMQDLSSDTGAAYMIVNIGIDESWIDHLITNR